MAEQRLSADDIAAHLGAPTSGSPKTVHTGIAEKAMPAHKVGRPWKFQGTEVDEWVRRGGAAGEDAHENSVVGGSCLDEARDGVQHRAEFKGSTVDE